jgi:dTDP-4-dehydrorhamnose 3,5-epimerase
MNVSVNAKAGKLRGMHCQHAPSDGTKLVCFVRAAILDVVIELPAGVVTRRQHLAVSLDAVAGGALFEPLEFAHGLKTVVDDIEVSCMIGMNFEPAAQEGLRWDDPDFAVVWPLPVNASSRCDATNRDFAD